jgi:hypothetical protein
MEWRTTCRPMAVHQVPSARPTNWSFTRAVCRRSVDLDICPDVSRRRPSDVIFPKDVRCDNPVQDVTVTRQHHTFHEDGAPDLNVSVVHLPPRKAPLCNVRVALPSRPGMDAISCDAGVWNQLAEQLVKKRRLPACRATNGCENSALHHAHTMEPDMVFQCWNVSAASRYHSNPNEDG